MGGSYVYPSTVFTNIPPGRWIEVEGVVGKGVYAPIILESKVTFLPQPPRNLESPRPRSITLRDLAVGRDDAQWIEMPGVVRRINLRTPGWTLLLATPTAQVVVHVIDAKGVVLPSDWVNSRIRVRGVCIVTSGPDQRRKADLFCSSYDDLALEGPAPAPLFQEPFQPLDVLVQLLHSPAVDHRVGCEAK